MPSRGAPQRAKAMVQLTRKLYLQQQIILYSTQRRQLFNFIGDLPAWGVTGHPFEAVKFVTRASHVIPACNLTIPFLCLFMMRLTGRLARACTLPGPAPFARPPQLMVPCPSTLATPCWVPPKATMMATPWRRGAHQQRGAVISVLRGSPIM